MTKKELAALALMAGFVWFEIKRYQDPGYQEKLRRRQCNKLKEGLVEFVKRCDEVPFHYGKGKDKKQFFTAGEIAYHLLRNGHWIFDNESINCIGEPVQDGFCLPGFPRINENGEEDINIMALLSIDLRAIKKDSSAYFLHRHVDELLGSFLSGNNLVNDPTVYMPNWIMLGPSTYKYRTFLKGLILLHEGCHWFIVKHNLFLDIPDESIRKILKEIATERFILDCFYQYGGQGYQQFIEEMAFEAVKTISEKSFSEIYIDKYKITELFGQPDSTDEEDFLYDHIKVQYLLRAFQISSLSEQRKDYLSNFIIAEKRGFIKPTVRKINGKKYHSVNPSTPLLKWL